MKQKLSLIITLIAPLFILNCSGKTTINTPKINPQTPVYNIPSTNSSPLLGRPIESISTPPPPLKPTKDIKKRPHLPPTPHKNISTGGTTSLLTKFKLPRSIKETSGLIKVDGKLWTINDSGGEAKLYQIDEKNGRIIRTVSIKGAYNHDWEALTYDDHYVYIGDFGNNRGNRRDLKIYKISRKALKNQKHIGAKTINFVFNDQKDFHSRPQKHNFDCEAMVAYHGKLYLFSKNWQDQKTRLYQLSNLVGTHKAYYKDSFNVQGLITDATVNRKLDILLLTSYSKLLSVNLWVFTNYPKEHFFKGESKKLTLNRLNAQVEGVTFIDNYKAYLSSEAFSKYIFSFDASLYQIDFSREFK